VNQPQLHCSFCAKSSQEVRKLIAGPEGVYICNECIQLSHDIIATEDAKLWPGANMPERVAAAFARSLVGQITARRVVLATLRHHLAKPPESEVDVPTPTVLLVGPSGSGKTTLGRALVRSCELPAFLADMGRVTATGYIGEDVENLLGELRAACGGSTEQAERGVLVLDGVERVRATMPSEGATSRDIVGVEVQRNLIRVLDGAECRVWTNGARHPRSAAERFSCRGLMRVLLFRLDAMPHDLGDAALRKALVAAGLLPAVVSRISAVIPMPALGLEELRHVVTRPDGHVTSALRFAQRAGVDLGLEQEALERLADRADSAEDGVWSVERDLQKLLLYALSSAQATRFVVDAQTLDEVLR